jgi:WD40 repeat protein
MEPMLCIEAGNHTARSNDASLDVAERFLLTAGQDKTARLWSVPDLRLLCVLRPPIGPEREGMLYAAALSPRGDLAAVGGFTGRRHSSDFSVYIFDVSRRSIVQRLQGLPNVIRVLRFSPDGRRLVAALGLGGGIRLWRTSDWTLISEDSDLRDRVHGLDFAVDGRLAVSCYDGDLRLYDNDLRRLTHVSVGLGRKPYHLRFDPRGERIAVGYADQPIVEIRDGHDLHTHRSLYTGGIGDVTNLSRVGWSIDGHTLYAGSGNRPRGSRSKVLAWSNEDQERPSVATSRGFTNPIASVLPLHDRRLLVTSQAGEIAIYDLDGGIQVEHGSVREDFAIKDSDSTDESTLNLRLSHDASIVEWTFDSDPGRPLSFHASELALEADRQELMPGLAGWRTESPVLRATEWRDSEHPLVNERPLKLRPYERAWSVDVADQSVLLGTNYYLRRFDRSAQPSWNTSVPGTAWRVKQSPSGCLAVAAVGDGTIRWFRLDNGKELLSLFVTGKAPRRWVAFSPSGYYAAGPGGEDLVGWHINRGANRAADFFPASRFRDRFYRPDVVARILETLDEVEALRQADMSSRTSPSPSTLEQAKALREDLPPVVTILAPTDDTEVPASGAVVLEIEVRSPSGKSIKGVSVLVDGRPASSVQIGTAKPLPVPGPGETAEHRRIELEPRSVAFSEGKVHVLVQVIARTDDRVSATASVRLSMGTPAAAASPLRKPRLNAVLVGIADYRQESLRLRHAAKDADDLQLALQRQEGGLYREFNVRKLTDAKAEREALVKALVWLQRETTQLDTALLFLAGHGVTKDGEFFFLPAEVDQEYPQTGISGADLRNHLRNIPGRVVAFLDTCYAGALAGRRDRSSPDMDGLVNELSSDVTGVIVYSATTARERAEELDDFQNGVFTHALLRALLGPDDMPDADRGAIRPNALWSFLTEKVKELTKGQQHATFVLLDAVRNLPLFMRTLDARSDGMVPTLGGVAAR